MSRYGRRVSRGLIGALIVTVVLGAVFYFRDTTKTRAAEEVAKTRAANASASKTAQLTSAGDAKVPAALPSESKAPATQPTSLAMTLTPTLTTATPSTKPAAAAAAAASASGAPLSLTPLADAARQKDAGDLLKARRTLNDALIAGKLSPADTEAAKKAIAEINQTVVFSTKRFADDEFGGTYSVQPGDLLKKIAEQHDVTWEFLARLNGLSDPKKLRAGQTIKVAHGPFNVVVSKSRFTMDVYLGNPGETGSMYITTFGVGLGKDDSTPTGVWLVEPHKKIKNPTYFSPRGEGIIDADDPKNPLGERWVGLSGIDGHAVGKASYGIHGTIDETSIGKMESMGCIRMHNADVEVVYDMLVEGKSKVEVRE